MSYEKNIRNAKTIAEIFEIVQTIVREYLGKSHAGLMVGLADLGNYGGSYVGAFYSLNANAIIINKRALNKVASKNPGLYNYYLFHVLLHEYVHAVGSYDEQETRDTVAMITDSHFGKTHMISRLSQSLPDLFPKSDFRMQEPYIEFVHGIDRRNTNYIN